MRRLGDESGQTLVMVALSMAVLLGFAAFATDIGVMLRAKRQVQSAADSAAIAAAWGLSEGSGAVARGTAAATANGYTQGTSADGYATTVDIESTPIDGQFAGQSGYVEAIITQQVPTFFMHMFGRDSATVAARAVATDKGSSLNCLTTTKATDTTLIFKGSFHVQAPGCAVSVQSSDPDALQFTGGAGSLTAASVSVVGGDGGQTGDSTPTPTTGAAYSGDPLAGQLTAPSYGPSGTTPCTDVTTTGIGTTGSQTYIPNPTGTVCYSSAGNINLTNVNLAPGTYIFNNPTGTLVLGGAINGPAKAGSTDPSTASIDTSSGAGVTLYILGGMNETAGTVLNLYAPGSGSYSGILLWGAGTYAGTSICPTGTGNAGPGVIQVNLGNSSGNFYGIIYAPTSDLVFQDSGSDSNGPDITTNIVVGTMCDQTADINITSYTQASGNGRFPRISLVE
ncbi:MAG TPA: pilus assembly protein TadG-related protein [Acidobacteriaceae bacterium]|nr:pilus assembly protein TadG-related protein [Acidobacteriaceae bacterium]